MQIKHLATTTCALATFLAPHAVSATPENQTTASALPLEQIQRFAEVFDKIKRDYVEPVTDEELLTYAIEGMLSNLDPHSVYFDPSDYENFTVDTEGQFGGLGIEISVEGKKLLVIAPIDDTPAARAGMQAGDQILKIDGQNASGLSQDEAVDRLRGKPGSRVKLTVLREGSSNPITVDIKRAVINIASVKSELLPGDFGYIRIAQFQRETGLSLRKAMVNLKRQAPQGLAGLVLDLRNNPGGILSGAVEVSNSFLNGGNIVSTKGREASNTSNYTASAPDLIEGIPVVVLVNGGSASAAEIVAGALQDHDRAVIMGTQTFGKGSVQTIFPLNNNAAIKFTTARYYTPDNRSIQAKGITPDIIVEQTRLNTENKSNRPISEADLPGHLDNESTSEEAEITDLIRQDRQLDEALKLLKGITIAGSGTQKQG